MYIPKTTGTGYGHQSSMVSYIGSSEKEKVKHDILPRIGIIDSKKRPIDKSTAMDFVNEVILPAFENLYERWPETYKLLMRTTVPIVIVGVAADIFKPKTTADAQRGAGQTVASGATLPTYPDSASIFLNLAGDFTNNQLKRTTYHEIMHAMSHLAVKDEFSKKEKKGKINTLSASLDKHYNNKLSRLAANYRNRIQTAMSQLKAWDKENENKYSQNEFLRVRYQNYGRIMDENKCWIARRCEWEDTDNLETVMRLFRMPDSAEEFLVDGLLAFFGSERNVNNTNAKKRLMEQEFGLYDMIETVVCPVMKKAPFSEKDLDKFIGDIAKKQHQK